MTKISIDDEYHPWLRGYKISVTFSCPTELLTKIQTFRGEKRLNITDALKKLCVYGLIYDKVLQEQALQKEVKPTKSTKKKKSKPKTPSK